MRHLSLPIAFLLTACGTVTDATPDGPGPSPDGGDGDDAGHVTYTRGGELYRLQAAAGATPENLSAMLAPAPRDADRRVNLSPDGEWLVFETSNLDAACPLCLAVAPVANPTAAVLVAPDGEPITSAENLSAIDSSGELVVFAAGGGPHARDLWVTRRDGQRWNPPSLLTEASPFEWNDSPTFNAAGDRVLFDCGPEANAAADGSSICEWAPDTIEIVAGPSDAPGDIAHVGPLHHADYAPDGSLVFEADWDGERVWRLRGGVATPVTSVERANDHSPCVLPDGRIASLDLDDPGIKLMNAAGGGVITLLRADDLDDVGLGCGA